MDSTSIAGPIVVKSDSRARVAFELMDKISHSEEVDRSAPRQYWLGLYLHCLRAVHGEEPTELQERPASRLNAAPRPRPQIEKA